jgi:ketosteroid isomerase-like protein
MKPTMLKRLILAAALALSLVPAALRAEDLGAGDAAAIKQVIADQLAAFQRDDAAGAYAFAAPSIKMIFPTPDVFMSMVRQAYQPVYRPSNVEFRELKLDGSVISQDVFMVGPDGLPVVARYTMERQADGTWKISGCYLTKTPDLSA